MLTMKKGSPTMIIPVTKVIMYCVCRSNNFLTS